MVFGPTLFLGFSIAGVLSAMVLNTLWQPLSYYIGWYVPFTLFGNPARSANWGEFGIGIGWALALAGLVWL